MKRRMISLVTVLVLALALALSASADLIWTPEDSFYESHREECVYVNRQYEMAGYDGTVAIWDAPGGTVRRTLSNGAHGRIQFTWSGDGMEWGYLYSYYEDSWQDPEWGGWVPMDDLALIYDSQQFMEDHESEITTIEDLTVDFDAAVVYSYPGGPSMERRLEENLDYMPFSEAFSDVYTDANGLRWGYVVYYMGLRDGWVCLDDPMNEHLDTNIVPVALSAAQLRDSATVTPGTSQQSQLILAGALVAAVVIVTAVIILKFHPKKKSEE